MLAKFQSVAFFSGRFRDATYLTFRRGSDSTFVSCHHTCLLPLPACLHRTTLPATPPRTHACLCLLPFCAAPATRLTCYCYLHHTTALHARTTYTAPRTRHRAAACLPLRVAAAPLRRAAHLHAAVRRAGCAAFTRCRLHRRALRAAATRLRCAAARAAPRRCSAATPF